MYGPTGLELHPKSIMCITKYDLVPKVQTCDLLFRIQLVICYLHTSGLWNMTLNHEISKLSRGKKKANARALFRAPRRFQKAEAKATNRGFISVLSVCLGTVATGHTFLSKHREKGEK